MCTQYISTRSAAEIGRLFSARVTAAVDRFGEIDGELFPGRIGAVVGRAADGERGVAAMRWGWPPPPAKPGERARAPVVNVRNLASPFWRSALADPARRCLVPVSRFCEWGADPETGGKRRYWFDVPGEALFAFAGLWRPVPGTGPAYAFLTCAPNALVGAVHPKAMPVILRTEDYDQWLHAPFEGAAALAVAYPAQAMRMIDEGKPE